MLYTLLIYAAEERVEAQSREVLDESLAGHGRLQEKAKAEGAFVLANRLMPTATAGTFRHGPVEGAVLDGPFAETKEQLLGLYVMDCKSREQAMEYARMIPMPFGGCIEVRPIGYYEGPDERTDGQSISFRGD